MNSTFEALLQRGYDPVHAAALAGHMEQESGGDPTRVNAKEDAHGLLQWRLDRWQKLQDFARARNADPTDRDVQLDFIGQEMAGPEAKAGQKFLATSDLPSASAALKSYIRFGDQSDPVRLANAAKLLGPDGASAAAAPTAPPAPPAGGMGMLDANALTGGQPIAAPGPAAPPPAAPAQPAAADEPPPFEPMPFRRLPLTQMARMRLLQSVLTPMKT